VALSEDGSDRVFVVANQRASAAEALPTLIQACLRDAGCRWSDIARLATTTGPGSFTSLRAALATVKGLALARRLPVLPMTAFECLAWFHGGPLGVVVAAGRGQCYHQSFDVYCVAQSDPVPVDDGHLSSIKGRLLATSGQVADALRMLRPDIELAVSPPICAEMVTESASRMLAGGASCLSGDRILPLYLRPPDARMSAGKSLIVNRAGS